MKWALKNETGEIIGIAPKKLLDSMVEIDEDYDVGFDGKLYSETELQSEEYQKRKSAFDKEIENSELSQKYIPSKESSLALFAKAYLKSNPPQSDVEKLEYSGIYDEWTIGNYSVGDIRNYAGQTWECWTAHDNAIYPDITPDNPQTWANFWRPLHGESVETARPWVKPQYGTTDMYHAGEYTDMYHAGEYMVYIDEKIYKCVLDTVYSPDEYAAAWEVIN